jgi:hypothetical protein
MPGDPDHRQPALGRQQAHHYEPDINPAYQAFAEHYGLAVNRARVRKPRDKAKVEAGVLVVERWVLACLRHHTLFSLSEANERISAMPARIKRSWRYATALRARTASPSATLDRHHEELNDHRRRHPQPRARRHRAAQGDNLAARDSGRGVNFQATTTLTRADRAHQVFTRGFRILRVLGQEAESPAVGEQARMRSTSSA